MKLEVDGPPFAEEDDLVEIGDPIRRGDIVWFDRVAPQKVIMRLAVGEVSGPRYRIDRGGEPDVFKLIVVEQHHGK
jgi:hypothetical protein